MNTKFRNQAKAVNANKTRSQKTIYNKKSSGISRVNSSRKLTTLQTPSQTVKTSNLIGDKLLNENEVVDSNSVVDGEVQCIEKALSISQDLRTLKVRQNALELKLKEIENELIEVIN